MKIDEIVRFSHLFFSRFFAEKKNAIRAATAELAKAGWRS